MSLEQRNYCRLMCCAAACVCVCGPPADALRLIDDVTGHSHVTGNTHRQPSSRVCIKVNSVDDHRRRRSLVDIRVTWTFIEPFLPRDAYALARYMSACGVCPSVCPSVRPSVRPSVCHVRELGASPGQTKNEGRGM